MLLDDTERCSGEIIMVKCHLSSYPVYFGCSASLVIPVKHSTNSIDTGVVFPLLQHMRNERENQIYAKICYGCNKKSYLII